MIDLTLDICVLMSGSCISDPDTNQAYGECCHDLLERMIVDDQYNIAMDDRGKVRNQYENKLNWQTFGHFFIRQMATMGKTCIVIWQGLDRGTRVRLQERGFNWNREDYKFVVVASQTECGKLVSHENHFFNIQDVLRRISISVLWPHEV